MDWVANPQMATLWGHASLKVPANPLPPPFEKPWIHPLHLLRLIIIITNNKLQCELLFFCLPIQDLKKDSGFLLGKYNYCFFFLLSLC